VNINSVQAQRNSLSLVRQAGADQKSSVLSDASVSRLDLSQRESASQGETDSAGWGNSESHQSIESRSNSDRAEFFREISNDKFLSLGDQIKDVKPFENGKPVILPDFIKEPFENGKPVILPDFIKPPFDNGKPVIVPDNNVRPIKEIAESIADIIGNLQGGEVELDDPAMLESHQGGSNSYQDIDGEVFVDGAEMTDVNQGAVGDCYLMAALASLAKNSPETLQNMITDNENGTYTVHFGGEMGDVTVDDDFAVNQFDNPLYAQTGDDANPELWVAIIEKAFAQGEGSFDSIVGGWANEALAELTGQDNFTIASPGSFSPEALQAALDNKQSVTASSVAGDSGKKGDLPSGIVRNHAYVVNDVRQNENGEWEVQVYNPWGSDSASGDGNSDGLTWISYDEFSSSFRQVEMMNTPFAEAA